MEVLVEISKDDAEKLRIESSRLTFEELRDKIVRSEALEALEECHKSAKLYDMDKWTMEDVNNLIAEAKADYNAKSGD